MPRAVAAAPKIYPVTLAEAKDHLEIPHDADNAYIQELIRVATATAEDFLWRALMTQTWDFYRDDFCDEMEIPLSPLQSVTSISYVDLNGATQTLDSSFYTVDADSEPGRVVLAYGQSWPSVRDEIKAVTIRAVVGYGAANDVPSPIRHAIKLIIGELYQHREESLVGPSLSRVPRSAESLMWPYRWRFV